MKFESKKEFIKRFEKSIIKEKKLLEDKNKSLSVGDGLHLLLHTNGKAYWEFRYTSPETKKRVKMGMGTYPAIEVSEAIELRDEYVKAIIKGIDAKRYRDSKKEATNNNNFTNAVTEWLETTKSNITPKTRKNIKSMMLNDIKPFLINERLEHIKHPQIVKALEKKNINAPAMAQKLFRYCNEFFQWSCTKGYCEFNIMMNIHKKSILPPHQTIHHKTITEHNELKSLVQGIYNLGNEQSKTNALRFLLHVPLRANNLINLKWESIDFEKKLLTIPRKQMKNTNPNLEDFTLPLTDEAMKILKDQYELVSRGDYVFTSPQFEFTHISDNTLNKTLKEVLKVDIRLHGFRSMHRSLANSHIKEHKTSKEARESILDHNTETTTEKAYTHKSNFLKEQKTLLKWWSKYILKLRDER